MQEPPRVQLIQTISGFHDTGAYDAVIAFNEGYAAAFAAQHPFARCPLRFYSISEGCRDEDAGEAARWRASLRPEAATQLVEVRAEPPP